ncbi:LPS translocon maturation chaperone LptM [Sphaerotilus microaerophilus]|uniref:LPS translocon maturation chaperone LptM n=1 Tax=Sphaerotilus microaerophilus TaxID=2914710 RepID=UPI002111290B
MKRDASPKSVAPERRCCSAAAVLPTRQPGAGRRPTITASLITCLLLAACGQKGSLYLPVAAPPAVTTPAASASMSAPMSAPASAPASQPAPPHSPSQPR